MSRVSGIATAAGCAVLMLTGCGAVNAITSHFESAPQRANSDAAAMLASFVPPEGAVRLGSAPTGLSKPMTMPISPNLVDKTAYWQASGSPQDVLTWEKTHLSSRFTLTSHGTSGRNPAKAGETFALLAVAGVLFARILEITAIPEGGRTAIRVDSQVVWIPSSPSSERITASTHSSPSP